jgi:hypothetical protein
MTTSKLSLLVLISAFVFMSGCESKTESAKTDSGTHTHADGSVHSHGDGHSHDHSVGGTPTAPDLTVERLPTGAAENSTLNSLSTTTRKKPRFTSLELMKKPPFQSMPARSR